MAASTRRKPAPRQARRPQARSTITRERLLRAAAQLFSERGYDTSSMADVAERAGAGVGTLYHHFPDKRALLLAMIDEWTDRELARGRVELDGIRANVSDLRPAIRGYLASRHRAMSEDGDLTLLLRALGEHDPEVRSRLERLDQFHAERVRDLITFGQAQGVVRREVDPIPAALLIRHAVRGAATEVLVHRLPEADPERVLDALTDMIHRYLAEEKKP
ncbi:MAG: helix-turn-helix domain-containing protein [Myxococcota bacterium]